VGKQLVFTNLLLESLKNSMKKGEKMVMRLIAAPTQINQEPIETTIQRRLKLRTNFNKTL